LEFPPVKTRAEFALALAGTELTHVERAVAFLWYYRAAQQYDDRTASELATDLREESFPKPNVTVLSKSLIRSRDTIRGRRPGSFQISLCRLDELNQTYQPLLGVQQVDVTGAVIPPEFFRSTKVCFEQLARQVNGTYNYGFYDACAVLCRRLMETLVLEVYIVQKRTAEVQSAGKFLPLEKLLAHVAADKALNLSRNSPGTMAEVKLLGDTAAHDRTYIAGQQDIDDIKLKFRKMVSELLSLAIPGRSSETIGDGNRFRASG
jgi:hypothetical protein